MKTKNEQFAEWFGEAFPYCYGTGEEHVIPALKKFMALIPADSTYDYKVIEQEIGAFECWALINELAGMDLIEYGCSPRFGWLTAKGKRLQQFVFENTEDAMLEALGEVTEDSPSCATHYCNCGGPQSEGCKFNVFFNDHPLTHGKQGE